MAQTAPRSSPAPLSKGLGTQLLSGDDAASLRDLLPESEATVLTLDGRKVDLVDEVSTLLTQADAVLIGWLRHYGCTLCMRQAAEWNTELRERIQQGPCGQTGRVEMILVGSGTVPQANNFLDETKFTGRMYTNPDLKTYSALGFARGVQSTFTSTLFGFV